MKLKKLRKKPKYYYPITASVYTLVAIALMIYGIIKQDNDYLIGAIIVGICSFYWISKAWRNHG